MRTLKAGIALALVSSFLLAPLSAATRQDGVISGSASAEVKKPYDPYTVRARDVSTNTFAQKTTLDANAEFAVNGLTPGTFLIELVKDVFKKLDFPIPVKDVRMAKDPFNATAKGALVAAQLEMSSQTA